GVHGPMPGRADVLQDAADDVAVAPVAVVLHVVLTVLAVDPVGERPGVRTVLESDVVDDSEHCRYATSSAVTASRVRNRTWPASPTLTKRIAHGIPRNATRPPEPRNTGPGIRNTATPGRNTPPPETATRLPEPATRAGSDGSGVAARAAGAMPGPGGACGSAGAHGPGAGRRGPGAPLV